MNNQTVDIKGLMDSYEFPVILPGSGQKVLIKPITTGQMKKILVYENEEDSMVIEEALDKLVNGCILDEGVTVGDMYLEDRFFLLVELRKITKGNMYSMNMTCGGCKSTSLTAIDLSKLPVTTRKVANRQVEINDKLTFEVDFPTRNKQKEAVEYVKKRGFSNESERMAEIMTVTFALSVDKVLSGDQEIEGVPLDDRIYVLDNISNEAFNEFKQWFVDNQFGVDFTADIVCAHCGKAHKMDIPLHDFFV